VTKQATISVFCALLMAGCSDDAGSGDSGTPPDSGVTRDQGSGTDSGSDPDGVASPDNGVTPNPDNGVTTNPDKGVAPNPDQGVTPNPDQGTTIPPGKPYGHVSPGDVGKTLGVGVKGPVPTATYTGPTTITSPTTIQDKVINGCLDIRSSNVTLRNVILKCSGLYPVDIRGLGQVIDNVVVEYSRLECDSYSKLFMVGDVTNLGVRNNEMKGCEDFFFVGGKVDGMKVTDNYMHGSKLTSASHADGFQIGEASTTTGTITVTGNMILADTPGGRNGIMFATNYCKATINIENNYLDAWGYYVLRCNSTSFCLVRHNVFDDSAAHPTLISNGKIVCNRYESGTLIQSGTNTGCPSYP